MTTMTWEVVPIRKRAHGVPCIARFPTEMPAREYARWRNEKCGWRCWKAREIPDLT